MTPEKIIEILTKYDFTHQKWVKSVHKQTTMIDPMDYHKIASEICQEQEKEMKEAIKLLKDIEKFIIKRYWIKNETLGEAIKRENDIAKRVNQFIQEY